MTASVIEFVKTAIADQIVGDPLWATVGLIGEVIFGGRFVLQWIVSEYRKESYVPTSFWIISLAGSLIMFIYSIHIKNPIFMLAFLVNTLI